MTEEQLTTETLKAEEAGDYQRLNELARMERRGNIDEADPKYAEGSGSTGSSGLQRRAAQAEKVAEAAGDSDLAAHFRSVADAEDPSKVIRQELQYCKGRHPDRAEALEELQADT